MAASIACTQELNRMTKGFMKLCMEVHNNYDLSPTDTFGTFEGRIYHSFVNNEAPLRIFEFILKVEEGLPFVAFKKTLEHPFISNNILCIVQKESLTKSSAEAIMNDIIDTFTIKNIKLYGSGISVVNEEARTKFIHELISKEHSSLDALNNAGIL